MHRYAFTFDEDADYIVLESFDTSFAAGWMTSQWIEHTRWMIPGTQLED